MKSFQELGSLVFSTNKNIDLSEKGEKIVTLENNKQNLVISTDKNGRKGKVVTLVDGFIGDMQDLEDLSKKIKKYCGVGGSTKDGQIIIQGDLKQKVAEILKKESFNIKIR